VTADPDFDLGGDNAAAEGEIARSPRRHSRDLIAAHFSFGRLPGTRVEGEHIAGLLGAQPWLQDRALEARLKAACSPRLLHLATHGFFLPDQPYDPNTISHTLGTMSLQGADMGRMLGPELENPLLRSGLALARVNTWLRGGNPPQEAEDGLLTAEDVSGLDLLDTELVVLSACETGLGEVRTGEGVFGLRRAFVLAGAKTLVMSLWKVPDLATAVLMERFYHNLLRGHARDAALREAQGYTRDVTVSQIRTPWLTAETIARLAVGDAELREELETLATQPNDFRPFNEPVYWGGFICQGDPNSLPPQTLATA
jgi:CHAT domain-containing protein